MHSQHRIPLRTHPRSRTLHPGSCTPASRSIHTPDPAPYILLQIHPGSCTPPASRCLYTPRSVPFTPLQTHPGPCTPPASCDTSQILHPTSPYKHTPDPAHTQHPAAYTAWILCPQHPAAYIPGFCIPRPTTCIALVLHPQNPTAYAPQILNPSISLHAHPGSCTSSIPIHFPDPAPHIPLYTHRICTHHSHPWEPD